MGSTSLTVIEKDNNFLGLNMPDLARVCINECSMQLMVQARQWGWHPS